MLKVSMYPGLCFSNVYSRLNISVLLYGTVIGGGTLLLGAVPMLFELSCEVAYPASESAANCVSIVINNILGASFLIPFAIPHIGESCHFYHFLLSLSLSLTPFLPFPPSPFLSLSLHFSPFSYDQRVQRI